jgi:hypothetical protein
MYFIYHICISYLISAYWRRLIRVFHPCELEEVLPENNLAEGFVVKEDVD